MKCWNAVIAFLYQSGLSTNGNLWRVLARKGVMSLAVPFSSRWTEHSREAYGKSCSCIEVDNILWVAREHETHDYLSLHSKSKRIHKNNHCLVLEAEDSRAYEISERGQIENRVSQLCMGIIC